MNKKLMVDEFVTQTLPFDKINEAFDLMHAGKRFEPDFLTNFAKHLCENILINIFSSVSTTASEPSWRSEDQLEFLHQTSIINSLIHVWH